MRDELPKVKMDGVNRGHVSLRERGCGVRHDAISSVHLLVGSCAGGEVGMRWDGAFGEVAAVADRPLVVYHPDEYGAGQAQRRMGVEEEADYAHPPPDAVVQPFP